MAGTIGKTEERASYPEGAQLLLTPHPRASLTAGPMASTEKSLEPWEATAQRPKAPSSLTYLTMNAAALPNIKMKREA